MTKRALRRADARPGVGPTRPAPGFWHSSDAAFAADDRGPVKPGQSDTGAPARRPTQSMLTDSASRRSDERRHPIHVRPQEVCAVARDVETRAFPPVAPSISRRSDATRSRSQTTGRREWASSSTSGSVNGVRVAPSEWRVIRPLPLHGGPPASILAPAEFHRRRVARDVHP